MASCLIGYYSLIDRGAQNIQGNYLEILTDPVYAQGADQTLLPMNCDVYQENKPWVPNPDFISEDSMLFNSRLYGDYKPSKFAAKMTLNQTEKQEAGEGIKLAGTGISLSGYGINLASRGKSKNYAIIHNKLPDIVPTFPDTSVHTYTKGSGVIKNALNDVQDVSHNIINKADQMLDTEKINKNIRKIKRPITNLIRKKLKKPGAGLRKKLSRKMNKVQPRKNLSTFEKKEYVKQLLHRLNPQS